MMFYFQIRTGKQGEVATLGEGMLYLCYSLYRQERAKASVETSRSQWRRAQQAVKLRSALFHCVCAAG
jgi:hypothetical protein